MKYILISFKSRGDVQAFASLLKKHNISYNIINTPSSISSSCGLSIKTSFSMYSTILFIIKNFNFTSILGVFIVETFGKQQNIKKIF